MTAPTQEPALPGNGSGRADGRTGLVVCGGASRRMGRDKALLELDGRTLLARAVDALAPRCARVLLACGPAPRYAHLGLELALDRAPDLGPLAGLEAGLGAAAPGWVLCLACDMPGADGALLDALLRRAQAAGADAALLCGERGLEPLCGVYHTRLLACARAALDAGERRMIALFRHPLADGRPPRLLVVDAAALGRPDAAWNVNAPGDLERRAAGARGAEDAA